MSRSSAKTLPIIFSLTLFTSAGLLFIVEPMIAKMILPLLGGTPAVWNTCMMFFQTMLLAGYVYAHLIGTRLSIRSQMIVQTVMLLLALISMPIAVIPHLGLAEEANPVGGVLLVLLISIGLPFFIISSLAPLLQKWFAGTGHPSAHDPYFLYSASNLGSMLALLSYPVFIEPNITLADQSRLWMAGYLIMAALILCCAYLGWKNRAARVNAEDYSKKDAVGDNTGASFKDRFFWIVLAFVPSSLMLGTTTFLTTDIASVPLFWIIPLSLYLLSFIIVFAKHTHTLHKVTSHLMLVSLTAIIATNHLPQVNFKWYVFILHLINLFIVSMVCHGELVKRRPSSRRLTEFYVLMSFGGVLGGIFNALAAPLIFNSIVEYPIVLFLAALLVPLTNKYLKYLKYLVVTVALWNLISGEVFPGKLNIPVVYRERSFFGVLSVIKYKINTLVLLNGTTVHGGQSLDPALRSEPTTYYQRQGAIGECFSSFEGANSKRRIAFIGLGVGTLASYGEVGQEFDFYEINPAIIRIATDPSFFTYLRDSRATWKIIEGDARLKIEKAPPQYYDLIVLDAFSSDAIPVHLLTREAFRLYLSKLDESGVLLVHITNMYLNLEPVLEKLSADAGLVGRIRFDVSDLGGEYFPIWVALARKESDLGSLAHNILWRNLTRQDSISVWTDDFSNILSVVKW